jgi:hypothetical protein
MNAIRSIDIEEAVAILGLDGMIAEEMTVLEQDGVVAALGGFVRFGGRLWAYTEMRDVPLRARTAFVRSVRDALHVRNETCFAQGEDTSDRFLTWLGFERTDEIFQGKRVYKWHHWQL